LEILVAMIRTYFVYEDGRFKMTQQRQCEG